MKLRLMMLAAVLCLLLAPLAFAEEAEPAPTPGPADAEVPEEEEAGEVAVEAKAKYQFKIYDDVRDDAAVIASVAGGTPVTIIEFSNEDWLKVRAKYWVGYVHRSNIVGANVTGSEPDVGRTPEPVSDFKSKASKVVIKPTGIAVGESDNNEIRYNAKARAAIVIHEEPNSRSRTLAKIKKGGSINVLAYGDDWCKVQTVDGEETGYCTTKSIYHYHSLDRSQWDIPWHDTYILSGWAEVTRRFHITDTRNTYKGQDLRIGDIIFLNKLEDGTYQTLLRRDWVTVDPDSIIYHDVVNWREAVEGDIVGGYTLFFGRNQGGNYYRNRIANIGLAMSRMDQTVIQSGEEYKFYTNIGPVTTGGGYKTAGVTGGEGVGVGGGVCHTSTLMYNVALSLPFHIVEREPHTRDGIAYVPLEFDATVGAYSDFRFINTLPYAVRMLATYDKKSGLMTVRLQCMETVDRELLANWTCREIEIPNRTDFEFP